jgi:hypothetical protein
VWRCPLGNVPPRDLTQEQADKYGGAEKLALSPLYEPILSRPKKGQNEVKDDGSIK